MTKDKEDPTSDLTPREKSAFFDLDLTQQMDIDRRRQLAGPLEFSMRVPLRSFFYYTCLVLTSQTS